MRTPASECIILVYIIYIIYKNKRENIKREKWTERLMGEIVTVVAEMDAEQTRNGDSAVDGKALRRESSLG